MPIYHIITGADRGQKVWVQKGRGGEFQDNLYTKNSSSSFFLYMINIAYCNLKDFDYATDLLSDLSLGIETSVVDPLICYLYFNSPVILAQLQVLAGSAHGLIQ